MIKLVILVFVLFRVIGCNYFMQPKPIKEPVQVDMKKYEQMYPCTVQKSDTILVDIGTND